MPSEPDSSIERQLRDYAERRRNVASEDQFRIHPVTRNSLKVEIVKQYGRRLPGQQDERSGWAVIWSRLAFAGTGLAILVAALLVFRPASVTEPESELARNDAGSVAVMPELPESEDRGDAFIPSDARSAPVPAVPGPESVHRFSRVTPKVAPTADPRRITLEAARSTPAPMVSAPQTAAGVVTDSQAPELPGRSDAAVLQAFQFIMNGDQVTVVDQDNSRYQGTIQPLNPDTISTALGTGPPLLGESTDPDFPRKYRLYSESGGGTGRMAAGQFTVTGMNLTLGKEIRFTGRMLTWTQAEPAVSSTTSPGLSSILQIRGTATFAGEEPVQVNATTEAE